MGARYSVSVLPPVRARVHHACLPPSGCVPPTLERAGNYYSFGPATVWHTNFGQALSRWNTRVPQSASRAVSATVIAAPTQTCWSEKSPRNSSRLASTM